MRDLVFNVKAQIITKHPTCDFKDIVSGTANYLRAKFMFSSEWNGHNKVAVFTNLSKEYPVRIKENVCIIPSEALTWNEFKVRVIGQKGTQRITTNDIVIKQEGGNV